MKKLATVLLLLTSSHALAVKSRPQAFGDYLLSEKTFQMPKDVSSENVKQGARKLLTTIVTKTQLPSKGWLPEGWDLDFVFPKRQSSAETWVSLSEASYSRTQNTLRARYDELRKKVPTDSDRQELFAAFALARAVIAESFRADFVKLYKTNYPDLDPQIFSDL